LSSRFVTDCPVTLTVRLEAGHDRIRISVSGASPGTQQWFTTSVFADTTVAPAPSHTSTRAGPYGAEQAPMESLRGGCTYFRSSSSTSFEVPRCVTRK
jgi:hypothetical protein